MMNASGVRRWHNSHWWCEYFRRQQQNLLRQPWDDQTRLSAEERTRLGRSLQELQQAEGLEGGHFLRIVQNEAKRTGDEQYAVAHGLFMAEEKRHAHDLGAFLDREGIPRLPANTPRNRLFRLVGGLGGFELTLSVVLHAEMIAQTYFTALRRATSSPLLRGLCTQILRDEGMHVRFHCERLAQLRRHRGRVLSFLTGVVDFLLFCGAWLACLWGHRSVLKAGGLSLRGYWAEASRHRRRAASFKNPRAYRWPATNSHTTATRRRRSILDFWES